MPDTPVLHLPVVGAFSRMAISFPGGRVERATGMELLLVPEMRLQPGEVPLLSHITHLFSVLESQLPHKIGNLLFTLTDMKNKLTNLWGD